MLCSETHAEEDFIENGSTSFDGDCNLITLGIKQKIFCCCNLAIKFDFKDDEIDVPYGRDIQIFTTKFSKNNSNSKMLN